MRVPATARPQEAPPAHELVLFFTRFPYPTETFLQREVTAFRALGVRLRLVSLWGGATEFETQRARALRDAYAGRLAARRDDLTALGRHLGWRCLFHNTGTPPRGALLWLYMAVGERA